MDKYKQINECKLSIGERWCKSFLVTYPVSIDYNGGIHEYTYKGGKKTMYHIPGKEIISGEHFKGFRVVPPVVPAGYKLTSIGCGLQMNAHPPYATAYLEPLDGKKKSKSDVRAAIR